MNFIPRSTKMAALAVTTAALAAFMPAIGHADSVDRLPESTVMSMHMPNGDAWLKHLKNKSAFGQMLSQVDRYDKLIAAFNEDDEFTDNMKDLEDALSRHNLKKQDLATMFGNDVGMAIVLETSADGEPVPVVLIWSGCGDMSSSLYGLLTDDDLSDEDRLVDRVDFKIKDIDASRMISGEIDDTVEPGPIFDEDGNFMGMQDAPTATPTFMAATNGYLIGAVVLGNATTQEELDLYTEVGESIFAQFALAHDGKGDGAFRQRLNASRKMGAEVEDGIDVQGLRMDIDMPTLIELVNEADPEAARTVEALGFNNIGPVSMAVGSNNTQMVTNFIVEASSPRNGAMKLLEQATLEEGIPAWLSKEAITYSQMSFNLGNTWDVIFDVAEAMLPPEQQGDAGMDFFKQMIDGQVQQVMGVDAQTALASIGSTHRVIGFKMDEDALLTATEGEVEDIPLQLAYVWDLLDAAPWEQLVNAMGMMADGEQLAKAEEQGFNGLAFSDGNLNLFVGEDKLILTVGKDVARKVITSISQGGDANAKHPLEANTDWMLPAGDVIGQSYSDMRNTMVALRGMVEMASVTMSEEEEVFLIESLLAAFPSNNEIEETLGMSTGQIRVTDEGLISRSVIELPAVK